MIDLTKYLGKKVYIGISEGDEDILDSVSGDVLMSLDEVKESASEDDMFVEIEITKLFQAKNKVFDLEEIK